MSINNFIIFFLNFYNFCSNNFNNFELSEFIRIYTESSSILGVLLLYSCIKSKDENKPFDLNILGEDISTYCYGYFISTVCTGLINGDIDSTSRMITIKSYESQNLKTSVNKCLDRILDDKEDVKEFVTKINNYFTALNNCK